MSAAKKHLQSLRNTTTAEPATAALASEVQLPERLDSVSVIDHPTPIPDADPDLVIGRLPRRFSTPRFSSSDEESLTTYYKRTGYVPRSESNPEIVRQVLAYLTMGTRAGRHLNEIEQQVGLDDRNVNWNPWHDSYREGTPSLQIPANPEKEVDENKKWNDDLQKCRVDPQEYVFQRTVMMSMINRHRFIYGEGSVLDFAVERPWTCSPMPTRALEEPDGRHLPQSQPDMAIAFRTTALMTSGHYDYLPRQLRNVVCYEGIGTAHKQRAFHFLMIEAKNTYKSTLDPVSKYQVLNSASQSLHNMYEFFNEAGPRHLANFFDKVRVFTAVSTTEGIIIRIHRAYLAGDPYKEKPSHRDRPPPKEPILDDYPLQFEYDIFLEERDKSFTHEKVVSALETIMVKYGVGRLLGIVKEAADDVIKKFKGQKKTRSKHHYSHHQRAHRPSRRGNFGGINASRHNEQSIHGPSETSQTTGRISTQDSVLRQLYLQNIEQMQELRKLNEASRSRSEDGIEPGSPTPTPATPRQTAGLDPSASLSENFETGLSVTDDARSHIEQTVPSRSDASPPQQRVSKRRGVPESEVTEHRPSVRSSRDSRSTGPNKRARPS